MRQDFAQKRVLEGQDTGRSSIANMVIGAIMLTTAAGIASTVPIGARVESWQPHTVRKGDTYHAIANRYGGNEHYRADMVYDMQKKNSVNPGELRENMTIQIPKEVSKERIYHNILNQIKKICGSD